MFKYNTSNEQNNEDFELEDAHDDFALIPDIPDPCDKVYSNVPSNTHMLKPVENCEHYSAKKFEYEKTRILLSKWKDSSNNTGHTSRAHEAMVEFR
jgi:hypothetical protein